VVGGVGEYICWGQGGRGVATRKPSFVEEERFRYHRPSVGYSMSVSRKSQEKNIGHTGMNSRLNDDASVSE